MPKVITRLFGVAVLSMVASTPALPDVVIKLENGSIVRVPIDPDVIESITFEAGKSSAQVGSENSSPLAPSPAVAGASLGKALELILPDLPVASTRPPIRVGSNQAFQVPSQAAQIAKDGDVVLIQAGTYPGDVAVWPQNNLTIRGVEGRPHLDAAGNSAEGKAIWVIRGTNILVENIEFFGCRGLSLSLLRMGGRRLDMDVRAPWRGQQWFACQ